MGGFEGEATPEGLWLTSTVFPPGGTVNDRFRLVAVEVGRGAPCAPSAVGGTTERSANIQQSTSGLQLPATGIVSMDGQSVRFTPVNRSRSPGLRWTRPASGWNKPSRLPPRHPGSPSSGTIADDGANKSVTLPATDSPQFFRLRRP